MYIEQGYKGKLGIWKYFIIPIIIFWINDIKCFSYYASWCGR